MLSSSSPASLSRHMDDFISVVKQLEDSVPGADPVAVLQRLRWAAGLTDPFIQHFLGDVDSSGSEVDASLLDYIRTSVPYRVTDDAREEGVVLTSDGSSVALRPLLLGIEAGFLSKRSESVRGLYQLTLAWDLGRALSVSSPLGQRLGPDGCWDSLTSPHVFTLSDPPTLLTTAHVNGGMDGLILGMEPTTTRLSSLLTEYYCHQLGRGGLDAAPRLVSRRRRGNFRELLVPPTLVRHVVKSVELQRQLERTSRMEVTERKQLKAAVKEGMKEFVHTYMGESTRPHTGSEAW